VSQSDDRMAELRELFFESAQELLQALNDEALKLENHPGDSEIVRTLRRIVHTLKGDAAACGYRELSEVAHELEDALALESAAAHASLAEVAFTAADLFSAMLAAYRKRIVAEGGKIHVEEQEVPGMGAFTLFTDPEGRMMGLWKTVKGK